MTSSQMGWLATQSMEAYGLWMAWLFQPDQEIQAQLRALMPERVKDLIAKAYRRN
jgi:hypothetical protein